MSGNDDPGRLPQPARHTRLDDYVDRYAARTQAMKASEIRALFAVASRPEVVSLAGGMPNISGLPLDAVAETLGDLVRDARHDRDAVRLRSGRPAACASRSATVMALEGIEAHPDDVVVTVGSQQAVDLVTRVFCDPGDVVLCEAPSYVGALGVFSAYECDVVHVEMDDDGLVPERSSRRSPRSPRPAERAKFLYTIPNFHNPAGVTLSDEATTRDPGDLPAPDLLVLEDNPYGLLGFDAEPMPRHAGRRAGAGRLSRLVLQDVRARASASGGRWRRTPCARSSCWRRSRRRCARRRSASWPCSAYLSGHDWRSQIKDFTEMYRERRDAMLAALDEHLPAGATWTVPAGGFYVWLTLPEGLDAKAMLPRAVTARVAYVPGTAFYADGFGSRCMRLSFCFPTPERIREGVRRLAAVIDAELELRETFGAVTHHLHPGLRRPPVRPELRRDDRTAATTVRAAPRGGPGRRAVARARRVTAVRPPGGRRDARRGTRGDGPRRRCRADAVAALGEAGLRHTPPARRGGRGRRAARGARARRRPVRRRDPRGRARSPSTSRSPSRWWRSAGLRTPEAVALPADTFREVGAAAVMEALVEQLGLPLFVKPAKGGSALGCSLVRTVDELPTAMVGCFSYGPVALVERCVVGVEVTVPVIATDGRFHPRTAGGRDPTGRRRLRLHRALHGRCDGVRGAG